MMKTWNERCLESLRREKKETEERYKIIIGKTSILCAKCGRPWGFEGHVCQEVRLKSLRGKEKSCPGPTSATLVPINEGENGNGDD
jgi:hypothetical protein